MTLPNALEAILFVADAPVPARDVAKLLEATEAEVHQAAHDLSLRLEGSSLQLVQLAGGYQLSTRPEFAELIGNFLKPQRQRLSRSLMEVLAIVAYRQPITMAEIDQIRGVQSDYSIRALLERRLVREVGRRQSPGRPVLYGTTDQFLHQFKLNDLSQLPPLSAEAMPNLPAQLPLDTGTNLLADVEPDS
ncbi:MAG TPA: SMC-Scp complex subunit ScpB [Fimbriimonadaceae bacterium]|nr:SMC-Scp complex subunit ScpB [Fimbriimonadaceae bacterium]